MKIKSLIMLKELTVVHCENHGKQRKRASHKCAEFEGVSVRVVVQWTRCFTGLFLAAVHKRCGVLNSFVQQQ
jgi:hypothetical protein